MCQRSSIRFRYAACLVVMASTSASSGMRFPLAMNSTGAWFSRSRFGAFRKIRALFLFPACSSTMPTQIRYKRRSSGCRLLASGCLRTLGAFLPIASAIVETVSWRSLAIREASSWPDRGLKRAGSALAKAGAADIQITSTPHDKVSFRYRKGIVKVILAGLEIQRSLGFQPGFNPT